jgi:hypothetical protein
MSYRTFSKSAGEEGTDKTPHARLCARQRRRRAMKMLVLVGAVFAVAAIACGATVAGLSIYLLTTLPLVLPA